MKVHISSDNLSDCILERAIERSECAFQRLSGFWVCTRWIWVSRGSEAGMALTQVRFWTRHVHLGFPARLRRHRPQEPCTYSPNNLVYSLSSKLEAGSSAIWPSSVQTVGYLIPLGRNPLESGNPASLAHDWRASDWSTYNRIIHCGRLGQGMAVVPLRSHFGTRQCVEPCASAMLTAS